jgi:glycosyltransferase involved in cell wall biosynthesis
LGVDSKTTFPAGIKIMRVLHVVTNAGHGGAGIAAARLVKGLRNSGLDAQIACLTHTKDCDPFASNITFGTSIGEKLWIGLRKFQLNSLTIQNYSLKTGEEAFLSDLSCYGMALKRTLNEFDIIHLHWVADFLDYRYNLGQIPSKIPILWTMHDMNPFTAGCSYASDCRQFETICNHCRILPKSLSQEASLTWHRKSKAFRHLKSQLEFIAPSKWIAIEAQKSSLCGTFPVHIIANCINTDIFKPYNQQNCKLKYGLSPSNPACLFLAANPFDPRKGMKSFVEAVNLVLNKAPKLQIVCLGNIPTEIKKSCHNIICIAPESNETILSQIYGLADFLVVPSLMDNLPNVIAESFACGVPVVSFPVGGIPEMVVDGETGILAQEKTSSGLTAAMLRMINLTASEKSQMKHNARAFAVKNYSIDAQTPKFISLYKRVLKTADSTQN